MANVDARLLVVGEGPQGAEWRELTRQLALEDKVKFLGRVSDEELVALYHACDVFVLPAIHRSESWGAVQVEAMACGKPVVATKNGGSEEIVTPGKTGLLCDAADPQGLAESIVRAIDAPWDASAIVKSSRLYSWENIGKEVLRMYSSII